MNKIRQKSDGMIQSEEVALPQHWQAHSMHVKKAER